MRRTARFRGIAGRRERTRDSGYRDAHMGETRNTDRLWPILRYGLKLHVLMYRATRGRIGHRFRGGPPMLLLDHVGARSGVKRTTPLVYVRDGENVVVVGSKGGHPRHPAWFHNLKANPDATIQIGATRHAVRARVADPSERARLWPKALETYPGYGGYQERTAREIPLVILAPRR
jgi:F420H(2)-dependent quinone reductase